MKLHPTSDLKLAIILATLGIPLRSSDPITCHYGEADKKTFTFWFDATEEHHEKKLVELLHVHTSLLDNPLGKDLDQEHPALYVRAALDNRESFLRWIKEDVAPMRIITEGERTLLISDRASPRLRASMKRAMKGDLSVGGDNS